MYNFKNFKNFGDAKINLFNKPLTIVIGKNGAGKSNLIEGIKVLTNLAKGVPLHEFTDPNKDGMCKVRGGLDNCIDFHASNFQLQRAGIISTSEEEWIFFGYSITIAKNGNRGVALSQEKLSINSEQFSKKYRRTIFQATRKGDMLSVEYDNFSRGGNNPKKLIAADRSVLSRYKDIISGDSKQSAKTKNALNIVNALEEYMVEPYIFDPDPKAMRQYERIETGDKLTLNGSNLSAILYSLRHNKSALNRINKTIRQLPEEPFAKMAFVTTKFKDVLLGFYADDKHKQLLEARLLSYGTLRMLAVLAALESVPKKSHVIIEEFDNGLHPSRAHLLINYLTEAVKRRELNVLVTTHNPAFMNALSDEQMKNVVLCHSNPANGHSKLTQFTDIPNYDLLKLQGGLGDLVTREVIEKRLSPEYEKERAKVYKKWAERYKV